MDGGARQLRSSTQKSGARESTDRVVPTSMRSKVCTAVVVHCNSIFVWSRIIAPLRKRQRPRKEVRGTILSFRLYVSRTGRPKRRNAPEEAETNKGRQTTADVPISEEEWDVAEYRVRLKGREKLTVNGQLCLLSRKGICNKRREQIASKRNKTEKAMRDLTTWRKCCGTPWIN